MPKKQGKDPRMVAVSILLREDIHDAVNVIAAELKMTFGEVVQRALELHGWKETLITRTLLRRLLSRHAAAVQRQ